MGHEGERDAVATAAFTERAPRPGWRSGVSTTGAAAALTACGGGGGGGGGGGILPIAAVSGGASTPAPAAAPAPASGGTPVPGSPIVAGGETTVYTSPNNAQEAARFLAQATLGAPKSEITALQGMSYGAWLDKQFALPRSQSHCDWMTSKGFATGDANKFYPYGLDATLWRKLISSPDLLRQRITLALTPMKARKAPKLMSSAARS